MQRIDLSIRHLKEANDPFEEEFRRWVNTFFGQQRPRFMPTQRAWVPPTDVYETEDAIHIRMEVAGVREEDVEVKLSGRYLIVRGKREEDPQVHKERCHLMEIQYGAFERVFALPGNFSAQNVTAKLGDGFLTIVLKKTPEDGQEYRIEIR